MSNVRRSESPSPERHGSSGDGKSIDPSSLSKFDSMIAQRGDPSASSASKTRKSLTFSEKHRALLLLDRHEKTKMPPSFSEEEQQSLYDGVVLYNLSTILPKISKTDAAVLAQSKIDKGILVTKGQQQRYINHLRKNNMLDPSNPDRMKFVEEAENTAFLNVKVEDPARRAELKNNFRQQFLTGGFSS